MNKNLLKRAMNFIIYLGWSEITQLTVADPISGGVVVCVYIQSKKITAQSDFQFWYKW